MTNTNHAINAIEAVLRNDTAPRACILCDRLTMGRNAFVPENSQEFGAPPNKQRVCIYAICERHERSAETAQRVESKLLMQIAAGVLR